MAITSWRLIHYVCILHIIFAFRASSQLEMKVQYKFFEENRSDVEDDLDHNIVRRDAEKRPTSPSSEPTSLPTPVYEEDNHEYYRSRYYLDGRNWWYDLKSHDKSPTFHRELSRNIKFSDTITTSFQFPYYGHMVGNVTITNKGYVFLGERLHKFNASAQYAAPLMTDFGADVNENTTIHYVDTGNRFTVEWSNIKLRSKPQAAGFSFQCSILKNGTLIFAYKSIPIPVSSLNSSTFPVRVGLSDTYRIDEFRHTPFTKDGKNYSGIHYIFYYLYHKVKLTRTNVVDNSAFVILPEPNCVTLSSCESCVAGQTQFSCRWCPKLKRCSDGIDRHRQKWLSAGCLKDSTTKCEADQKITAGEIVLIVLIPLAVIIALGGWFLFAYLHPQSKSGMLLIRYGNPMKWCRGSSEPTETTDSGGRGGKITFKTMSFESNT